MEKSNLRVFLVTLVISLAIFGAAAMWLIPSPPERSPEQPVTVMWQTDDAVSLLLVLEDGDGFAACRLVFDPAGRAITAEQVPSNLRLDTLTGTAGERAAAMLATVPADGVAFLTRQSAAAMLAALGNDLPLTLTHPVTVADDRGYLNLDIDTHVLTAEQVALLLRHEPDLWAEVTAAVVNRYGDAERLFRELVNRSAYTDLTVEDYLAAHDALAYLWSCNHGHLCRAAVFAQEN